MSLQKAIEKGEGKNLEFKVELPSGNTLAKTIIAFSNTGGGKVIIGVNNRGKIVGLKPETEIFGLQDKIASIIYETCYPNIVPDIYTTTIDNLLLLVIEVYRGNLLPYYLKKQGKDAGVYIRVGATNRKASSENILELERQRMNIGYDQEVDKKVELRLLDLSPLENKFVENNKAFDEMVMKSLKLVYEENGELYPTNSLLILLGEFEHVRMKCSRFKGNTMDVFLDQKEYTGDLFSQLENAETFIKNHISLGGTIKGLQREDQYEIPLEAIRESLINAVVHRDYSNSGRDIKVGIYDDIVNIVSPGAFPSTITQEDILGGRSEIRNKVIARVFKELNYIEQWGSGIRRIISSCKARGLKEPEILEKGDFVDVNLYRIVSNVLDAKEYPITLTGQEQKIIEFLKDHDGEIRTNDAETLLNVGDRRARVVLKNLADKQVIERMEKGSNTFYMLKASSSAE